MNKKILHTFILLFFNACIFTSDINPNEYSKFLTDMNARRPYPVLRKPIEVPMLIKALTEKSDVVRFNAAHDLKALGSQARDALIPLINKFADKDDRVAQVSFAAANRVMGDPYIPPPPPGWFFGTEKVDDPADHLIKYLNQGTTQQKIWSLMLLAKMGPSAKPAVPVCLKLSADSTSSVRYQAQTFLQKVDADISKQLVKALNNEKPEIRSASALALGMRAENSAKEELRERLSDTDSSVRLSAAEALARLGDKSSEVAEILTAGLGSISSDKEAQIVKLLNKTGHGSSVSGYYSRKINQEKQVQGKMKSDIENRARAASIKVREKLLRDREKVSRAEAMTQERVRSSKVEIPKLTAIIDTGTVPQRVKAIQELSALAPYYSDAFEPIVDALNNEHATVRAQAAKILGELRKTEAVENLILVLEDESVDVQDSAVAALTIIGTPEAMAAVSAFPEDMRKEAVKRALRGSAGQIQALVRCSEARALCKLVLQESGSPAETVNEESATCAYLVQPGC